MVIFVTIERHDPELGIKVVPMFIEGEDEPAEEEPEPLERTGTALLGVLALAFAVLTAAALAAGVVMATAGDYRLATVVAYGAIGLSVLAVIGGVLAVILGWGRRWGVIAVIVGVVADPLVLLVVLRFVGGLQTG
ncbi:MAG: Naphthoate synthase [Rhodoglobus sp.]|nr:Naphthoate synthase [Rhodoglobus sp.]